MNRIRPEEAAGVPRRPDADDRLAIALASLADKDREIARLREELSSCRGMLNRTATENERRLLAARRDLP